MGIQLHRGFESRPLRSPELARPQAGRPYPAAGAEDATAKTMWRRAIVR